MALIVHVSIYMDSYKWKERIMMLTVFLLITIHIVLTMLTVIVDWYAVLVDVRGAFLLGDWESDRQIYMEVPKGWTHHYPVGTVLRLLKTAYGAKQSAKRYWILWLTVMDEMGSTRSQADPCLYYKWHPEHGLHLMMLFIDDVCIVGTRVGVELVKAELFTHFDCDDTGEMKEYVGNKVDQKNGAIKLTQPVLLQSLVDEFKFERDFKVKNPAVPGTVLQPSENKLSPEDLFTYCSGTGKLLHLMKWSRLEIANSVRELFCYMTGAGMSHMKVMYRVFNYCLNTSTCGMVINPHRMCLSKDIEDFEFEIYGHTDSDYAKDPVKHCSVSGYSSFLEGCAVNTKSRMLSITALSVTEAELIAATECAPDLMYIKNVLESIGLTVRLPMNLHIDNSGCIDLICNWSAGGQTRHINTHMYFPCELKEEEPKPIVMPLYCPNALNRSDLFTKNNDTNTFEEHTCTYCMDEVFD
jgi:Reverse transcriptase (RNA-dependent DNA polymerase)